MSPKKTIYPPLQKGTYLLIIVLEYKHLEKCCFIVETREQETYCKGTRAFKILYGQGTRQDLWYVHISYTLVVFFLFFFFFSCMYVVLRFLFANFLTVFIVIIQPCISGR